MTDYVTEALVETVARALHAETCCPCDPEGCTYPSDLEGERALALTALTAVAPQIAAQALRDAADEVDLSPSYPSPTRERTDP